MTPAELERLIDRTIGSLWRGLLRALDLSRGGDFLTTLERYLLARNIQAAVDAVDLVEFQNAVARLQQQLAPIREAAWEVARLDLPKRLQADSLVRVSYPKHLVDRPDVQQAIARQDLSRIQGIARETQEAIRDIIARGLREGTHSTKLAREIREIIGLNRSQAAAVANYRAKLLADGVKRPPDRIERMVARYARKKLTERAETIARTEVIRAQSEGRRLQWLRLVAEGKLNSGEWQMEWLTARDERTCPICWPMHGQRQDIGDPFDSRDGPVYAPPVHPRCRCNVRLVLRGFREGRSPTAARDRILRDLGRFGGP